MMETLQIIWFILWGVLWAAYFMLDGFRRGNGDALWEPGRVGHRQKDPHPQRRSCLERERGLVGGRRGAPPLPLSPTTYALMFSNLYSALLLLLFALILRGISLELRGQTQSPSGQRIWDALIVCSSLVVALLLGVAFGNIFEGLPMDAGGYHGGLVSLLNPYGLVTGVLFILLFAEHGALYACLKTEGDLRDRAQDKARLIWPFLLIVTVTFLIYTAFATNLYGNYLKAPVLFLLPLVAALALLAIRYSLAIGRPGRAFAASCLTIVLVTFSGIAGLFPNLIPSSLDPAYSLTIFNSSSSRLTLAIMTGVAFILRPGCHCLQNMGLPDIQRPGNRPGGDGRGILLGLTRKDV